MLRLFRSLPFVAGKHNTGMIKATQPTAIAPTGFEKRPKFQGPGRNLSPTTNSFSVTGKIKRSVLRDSSDGEDGTDGNLGSEHEKTQKGADRNNEPYGVDGHLSPGVDLLQPAADGRAPSRLYA